MAQHGPAYLLPRSGRFSINCHNLIADGNPRLRCQRACSHTAHHRLQHGYPQHKHRAIQDNGQQQITHRPGRDYGNTPSDRLLIKGIGTLGLWHRPLTLIQHLDIATQGNRRKHILSPLAVLPTPQRLTETDGKTQHLDSTATGYPKVPPLMEGHQHPNG